MSTIAVSGIVFGCVFGGAMVGSFIRRLLPEHHLGADSKDLVKLGTGLIATVTALVLGLLVASTKGSFDTQRTEVTQMAAHVVLLDRVLAHYGPETGDAREMLRKSVTGSIQRLWATGSPPVQETASLEASEALYEKIQDLSPRNDKQRSLQAEALKIGIEIGRTRWLLFAQRGSSIPFPFLVVLVSWLTILFASFSLFAPLNATVIATLVVCALSVSGAILLILEMDSPFSGLIQISKEPLRNALTQLGK